MSISITPDAATQSWDEMAQRLEQFVATWQRGQEPTLAEYLPGEPPTLRRLVLVELVKIDLEQRTARGQRRDLEDYAREHPELLEDGEPPCDLIYEEFHVRRNAGEPVALEQYCQRFPRRAESLRRLIGKDDAAATSQLFKARRIEGILVGQRLDDFDLLVELGKGAFGSVYLARQVSMQRLVALKITADKGNEPQTLAQLDHPHIVRVYDQRQLADRKVRLLYMQYAPGGTLAEVVEKVRGTPIIARSGKILAQAVQQSVEKTGAAAAEDSPQKRRMAAATWPETVCRLGVQLAQALDHAHRQGILHRDVKPANVLLSADGSPKLADFNISFCSQLEGATPAAYFGGSLAYMSPEQLEACNPAHSRSPQDLDGRSDLYALAVVLWELLHGSRPYRSEQLTAGWTATLVEMTRQRRAEELESPAAARDELAQRLEQVLRRALSSDPERRHATGAELARELHLCLNPQAWGLLKGLRSGWRDFARRQPFIALLPVNLPPFVLAAAYHYWYNSNEIIANVPDSRPAFTLVSVFVNLVSFPLGVVAVMALAWPVLSAMRDVARGKILEADLLQRARRRALRLGHVVAVIGVLEWTFVGLVFPISIHWIVGSFPAREYLHFLLSSVAAGLISAGVPFLGTAWLAIRVFYPALLGAAAPDAADQQRLATIGKHSGLSLFAAGVVPLLALFLLAVAGSNNRIASMVLIAASLASFFAAYWIYGRIRSDLAALDVATRPLDSFGTASESGEY